MPYDRPQADNVNADNRLLRCQQIASAPLQPSGTFVVGQELRVLPAWAADHRGRAAPQTPAAPAQPRAEPKGVLAQRFNGGNKGNQTPHPEPLEQALGSTPTSRPSRVRRIMWATFADAELVSIPTPRPSRVRRRRLEAGERLRSFQSPPRDQAGCDAWAAREQYAIDAFQSPPRDQAGCDGGFSGISDLLPVQLPHMSLRQGNATRQFCSFGQSSARSVREPPAILLTNRSAQPAGRSPVSANAPAPKSSPAHRRASVMAVPAPSVRRPGSSTSRPRAGHLPLRSPCTARIRAARPPLHCGSPSPARADGAPAHCQTGCHA